MRGDDLHQDGIFSYISANVEPEDLRAIASLALSGLKPR